MKGLSFIVLMCLLTSVNTISKRLLIYTHNGKGYVHENITASVDALKKLCKENGYEADVTDNPSAFTAENLQKYQCIVFSNTNNEAFDTEDQRKAFANYIHNGGGYVGIHSASGSERQWPWFWSMQGGKFVRHPKFQKFTVRVIDSNHPATSFLERTWAWEDECYYLDNLNPDIHILLAADLTTVEDSAKESYPGKTFGDYTPLAWCHEFEGGREFYTALGHKPEHYSNEKYLRHLLGGIQWVMKEK